VQLAVALAEALVVAVMVAGQSVQLAVALAEALAVAVMVMVAGHLRCILTRP